jgi:hypothetical protein
MTAEPTIKLHAPNARPLVIGSPPVGEPQANRHGAGLEGFS